MADAGAIGGHRRSGDRLYAHLRRSSARHGLALSVAELCKRHRLPTADAIVYATALAAEAQLVTCDAHFEGLPEVLYFAKEDRLWEI
jgi:predicted nucleic acid-binding protein